MTFQRVLEQNERNNIDQGFYFGIKNSLLNLINFSSMLLRFDDDLNSFIRRATNYTEYVDSESSK